MFKQVISWLVPAKLLKDPTWSDPQVLKAGPYVACFPCVLFKLNIEQQDICLETVQNVIEDDFRTVVSKVGGSSALYVV